MVPFSTKPNPAGPVGSREVKRSRREERIYKSCKQVLSQKVHLFSFEMGKCKKCFHIHYVM